MKVSRIVQQIVPKDIQRANSMVSTALKTGYKKGSFFAQNNNITGARKVYTKSKSAVKELRTVKFKKEDAPALVAAIASILPIPIPGLSIIAYGVGHAIQYGLKKANQFRIL